MSLYEFGLDFCKKYNFDFSDHEESIFKNVDYPISFVPNLDDYQIQIYGDNLTEVYFFGILLIGDLNSLYYSKFRKYALQSEDSDIKVFAL